MHCEDESEDPWMYFQFLDLIQLHLRKNLGSHGCCWSQPGLCKEGPILRLAENLYPVSPWLGLANIDEKARWVAFDICSSSIVL